MEITEYGASGTESSADRLTMWSKFSLQKLPYALTIGMVSELPSGVMLNS